MTSGGLGMPQRRPRVPYLFFRESEPFSRLSREFVIQEKLQNLQCFGKSTVGGKKPGPFSSHISGKLLTPGTSVLLSVQQG